MRESYLDVSTRILNMRSHKDPIVRRMVITLIPTLASFDKQAFCENSLHVAAAHLIAMLDKPQERSFAFIALGHMAVSVGAEIRSYLENIMNHIKNGFAQRGYVDSHIVCSVWRVLNGE
jgi:FKBP12-rapamycin complex-associated protein